MQVPTNSSFDDWRQKKDSEVGKYTKKERVARAKMMQTDTLYLKPSFSVENTRHIRRWTCSPFHAHFKFIPIFMDL